LTAGVDLARLRLEIREFVDGTMRQWGERIEREGAVAPEMWQGLRERGYLRLRAPAEVGGAGLGLADYLPLLEEFSRGHGSLRMIVHVLNGIWRPLLQYGTPEQADRFVRPLVRGETTVAFAVTEPDAGSGADIRTEARREGGAYVVNGSKHLITFGTIADFCLVLCRLPDTVGAEGLLTLLVPRGSAGLVATPMAEAMGMRGSDHAHLRFSDCRVPADHRIGEEGQGLAVALEGFLYPSRISVGMSCVGLGRRALELALQRARERVTFGRPIGERQMIQAHLAEAATDLEAARQLVLWAARRWDQSPPAVAESAMAKLFALEALQRVTDRALQVWGGIGYFRDQEIERIYRDARAQRFEEGTAEIQKTTIARTLLADPQLLDA
jgi:alkylation response protein AidB-like acyl-CoA dehydrogenase